MFALSEHSLVTSVIDVCTLWAQSSNVIDYHHHQLSVGLFVCMSVCFYVVYLFLCMSECVCVCDVSANDGSLYVYDRQRNERTLRVCVLLADTWQWRAAQAAVQL